MLQVLFENAWTEGEGQFDLIRIGTSYYGSEDPYYSWSISIIICGLGLSLVRWNDETA